MCLLVGCGVALTAVGVEAACAFVRRHQEKVLVGEGRRFPANNTTQKDTVTNYG